MFPVISVLGIVVILVGIICLIKPIKLLRIRNRKIAAVVAVAGLVLMSTGTVLFSKQESKERISDYFTYIEVAADGTLTVSEVITVNATGDEIKRGIYRDFQTVYQKPGGEKYDVGFEIVGVQRDDKPIAYFTENRSNSVRVYMGSNNIYMNPGTYTYRFTYKTDRQIFFSSERDELYWNVTGNDWAFPIDSARASITLPEGATVLSRDGYTGRPGEKGRDWETGGESSGPVTFHTTRTLAPGEGFTISVTWPKGFVNASISAEAIEIQNAQDQVQEARAAAIANVSCGVLVGTWVSETNSGIILYFDVDESGRFLRKSDYESFKGEWDPVSCDFANPYVEIDHNDKHKSLTAYELVSADRLHQTAFKMNGEWIAAEGKNLANGTALMYFRRVSKAPENSTAADNQEEQRMKIKNLASCSGYFIGVSTALSGSEEQGMENSGKTYIGAAMILSKLFGDIVSTDEMSGYALDGRNAAVRLLKQEDIGAIKRSLDECAGYQELVKTTLNALATSGG